MSGPVVLVVMGVSGSGKTTVGSMLARRLRCPFHEGDDLHPQANIDKMKAGNPLTDADRGPWLELIADWVDQQLDAGQSGIITCSAPDEPAIRVDVDAPPEQIVDEVIDKLGLRDPTRLE